MPTPTAAKLLLQDEATAAWYPASLTKLMTVYVALDAVRNGDLTLDTPLIMSVRAARMPPSKIARDELKRSLALYSPERDAATTQMYGQNTQVPSS